MCRARVKHRENGAGARRGRCGRFVGKFSFLFGAGVGEAPLALAVSGAELGHKAFAPRWKLSMNILLLWLMVQESTGHYCTRPKTKSEYARQLLLLDRPFLLKLAPAQVVAAVVFVGLSWSP